jgi:hypothetical protein
LNIVDGSAPSETGKEIEHGVEAGNMGPPATRDNFAPTPQVKRNEKLWMMVMHLDQLVPYQGAARDELP